MAKDKYTISTNVDIIGRLDYNQQDELVVYIEKGKGDNMIVVEVPLMDILQTAGLRHSMQYPLNNNRYLCNSRQIGYA